MPVGAGIIFLIIILIWMFSGLGFMYSAVLGIVVGIGINLYAAQPRRVVVRSA